MEPQLFDLAARWRMSDDPCGDDLSLVDKHAKEACPVALSQKKKYCTNIANRAGVKKCVGVIFCAVVENI